jgi:hypothetical protein
MALVRIITIQLYNVMYMWAQCKVKGVIVVACCLTHYCCVDCKGCVSTQMLVCRHLTAVARVRSQECVRINFIWEVVLGQFSWVLRLRRVYIIPSCSILTNIFAWGVQDRLQFLTHCNSKNAHHYNNSLTSTLSIWISTVFLLAWYVFIFKFGLICYEQLLYWTNSQNRVRAGSQMIMKLIFSLTLFICIKFK